MNQLLFVQDQDQQPNQPVKEEKQGIWKESGHTNDRYVAHSETLHMKLEM